MLRLVPARAPFGKSAIRFARASTWERNSELESNAVLTQPILSAVLESAALAARMYSNARALPISLNKEAHASGGRENAQSLLELRESRLRDRQIACQVGRIVRFRRRLLFRLSLR